MDDKVYKFPYGERDILFEIEREYIQYDKK